jgi:hypothetical protein
VLRPQRAPHWIGGHGVSKALMTGGHDMAAKKKPAANRTNYWSINMANGWTQERRAKQAKAIGRWRPWEQSTGPTSDEGKAGVAGNAMKHGLRSAEWLEEQKRINALLRECRERLRRV